MSTRTPEATIIERSPDDRNQIVLRRRRRSLISGMILVGIVASVFLLVGRRGLKTRSQSVQSGMTRAEVEAIVGEPYLAMPRDHGRGTALVWVDQFWQVEVRLNAENRAEHVICQESASVYRRVQWSLKAIWP